MKHQNDSSKLEAGSMDVSPGDMHANNKSGADSWANFSKSLFYGSASSVSYLTIALEGLLVWALLFAVFNEDAEPGGQLFLLLLLAILSYFSGWAISLLRMPPLLGMILCGIVLRNIGLFHVSGVYVQVVSLVRQVSLAVILIQAGLGLDPDALKKLSFVVARLALLPGLFETAATAVAACIFLGMPWMWGSLLGCILSGVSPAVIIPSLLSLKAEGYGEDKGIATLIIAASTIDDIRSISMFGIILGIMFSSGTLVQNILHGPLEIIIGILAGFGFGFLCAYFPHRDEDNLISKRTLMVGGSGTLVILLSSKLGYSGSGPLAAIMIPLIASVCWKSQGWSKNYNPVIRIIHSIWITIQPLLFGLIGTDIKFDKIQLSLVWLGSLVILSALLVRILTCCFILVGANLNWKEVVFVNLAWLPKATVQATIGSIALDTVMRLGAWDQESVARDILTISVLSILLTAPVGAIGISLCGTKMLAKSEVMIESDPTKKQLDTIEEIRL